MTLNVEDDDHESLDPIEYGDAIDEPSVNHDRPRNGSPNHSQTSSTQPRDAAPTFLDRLSQLPMQRPMPWREGQELPPERSTGSPRVQQRGACLLATRGNISEEPCDHCKAGLGRFTHCITLGNWFQGACSCCIFTSKGNKCSSRLQKGKVDGRRARHQLAEEGGMVEERKPKPTKKRKRSGPAGDSTFADSFNEACAQGLGTIFSPFEQETSKHGLVLPLATAASPQTASPDMDSMLQAEIAREEPSGLLGYVHRAEKKQKRHHNMTTSPEKSQYGLPRDSNASLLKQAYDHHGKAAKAPSRPLSASPKPTPPPQHDPDIRSAGSGKLKAEGGIQSQDDESPGGQSIPLIDTFPKSKQRQLFALISGIQGGIDHLQKQLNLLQASLGVELEDS